MLDPARHQVLIVDDDSAVRDVLSLLLKASGYEVTTATNGREALELLNIGLPAILLSDLEMPEMSGLELFSQVRQKFPGMPVVAMSGAYETPDGAPFAAMADAFYPKGRGDVTSLLRILTEMLDRPKKRALKAPPLSTNRIN